MPDALNPSATAALGAWAARVRANRDQAERVREGEPAKDFYAPVASMFRADPRRTDEAALDALRSLVQPGERWVDIGAGGGRYTLPLALLAGEVIAVEPSNGMLNVLREGMAEYSIANIRILQSLWPMPAAPVAEVALISHIGYDIEEIGPFLDAMEAAATRLCVAVLLAKSPPYLAEPFWPPIHGEPRAALPALPEFLSLLLARGKLFEVKLTYRAPGLYSVPEAPLDWLYQQLFIGRDTPKGRELARLAAGHVTGRDGRWALSWEPVAVGIVTWTP